MAHALGGLVMVSTGLTVHRRAAIPIRPYQVTIIGPVSIRPQEGSSTLMKIHSSRSVFVSLQNLAVLVSALSALLISGCSADRTAVRDDLRKTRQMMEEQSDPRTFVDDMRRYALEKLDDLSDKEAQIIKATPPEISSNYDKTQFAFAWKIPEDDFIEVVSTPPPCIPMTAFRTRQVKYM
jgi:transcriptional regulator of nitric oxide reductase